MTLNIKINGRPYVNFDNASVLASITAMARAFSFVSTADLENSFPIKIGDEVFITADGIDVLEGYIEMLDISYDAKSHSIRVGGRSRLADLVDSTVPTQFEKTGTSLPAIASSVMSAIDLEPLVRDETKGVKDFGADIQSAEIGMNALEFLESYARKRQVLLTSDGARTLVLTRAGSIKAPNSLKNQRGALDNNILSSSRSIDYSKRYYHYLVKAQLNTTAPDFQRDPREVVDQQGDAFDNVIRTTRKLEMNAEESMDSFSAKDRAAWEKNIRLGNADVYSAKIVGNSFDGKLWLPNTLVRVQDEFAMIDEELLIREVQYNFNLNEGSTTELTMISPITYTLMLEQSEREENLKSSSKKVIKA